MGDICGTCRCHTSMYATCDVPGGCGSTGCGNGTRAGSCTLCPVFRPDSTPRLPNRPPVCDGDRTLLDRHLGDIANLIADLSNDEEPLLDDRRHERFGTAYLEGGHRHVFSRGLFPSDPVGVLGGVAPINSRSKQPSVSGSRERPIPIRVSELDLKAAAKVPSVAPSSRGRDDATNRGWPEDQIGNLSAATVLDQWVRDIRDTLYPGHHLPKATVDELVMWLRTRVEDVCDQHPAVAEFAEEIRSLRSALRSAAGVTDAQPEPCEGVPCRRCSMITLFRQPGGDVACINPDCAAVLRSEEYDDWTKTLVAEQRIKQHAGSDS